MRIVWRSLAIVVLLLAAFCVLFYKCPLWVVDQQIHLNLWRQGVRGGYIDADGYRVHYFEAKPRNSAPGTPLILIHGLGSRGEDWGPLIPQLAASGFHVYVPDLLGYGRSSHPDIDYSISAQERLVLAFLDAVHIPKADVAGWSMGGWVAVKLAVDYPDRVERLVLYDSAGLYFPATFNPSIFTPHDAAGLDRLITMLDPHLFKMPAFISNALVAKMQENAWVVDRNVAQMVNGRDLLDFKLTRIHTPTLIVWGNKDILIPLEVGESMHHLIPDSSMTVIDGCGHLAPWRCWHAALATTVQFLAANPPLKHVEQTLPGR